VCHFCAQVEHFPNILTQSGFTFNPRLVSNLQGVVDPWGQGQVAFGTFVWLHGLLTHAQNTFNGHAANGALPTPSLGAVLTALGYNLPAPTVASLAVFGDRAKSGHMTFEQLVSVIAFLLFTRNQFSGADQRSYTPTSPCNVLESESLTNYGLCLEITEQTNKLPLNVVEAQLLPALGLEGCGHDQAQAIFNKFDAGS
jgi:hypothetical protein